MQRTSLGQAIAHLGLQGRDVATHHGGEIGVGHRGRGALELAPFRRNPVRHDDLHIRQTIGQIVAHGQFMARIVEGEEQRNGNRLVGLGCAGVDQLVQIGKAQWLQFGPVRGNPATHGKGAFQRDQRLGLVPADRKDLAAVIALDGVDVAKILVGDQRHLRALAGEQGVEADSGAMHEESEFPVVAQDLINTLEHGECRIVRRGQHLGGAAAPGGHILVDNVCKCAADIGRHAIAGFHCS
jgi:hypothetical protein